MGFNWNVYEGEDPRLHMHKVFIKSNESETVSRTIAPQPAKDNGKIPGRWSRFIVDELGRMEKRDMDLLAWETLIAACFLPPTISKAFFTSRLKMIAAWRWTSSITCQNFRRLPGNRFTPTAAAGNSWTLASINSRSFRRRAEYLKRSSRKPRMTRRICTAEIGRAATASARDHQKPAPSWGLTQQQVSKL